MFFQKQGNRSLRLFRNFNNYRLRVKVLCYLRSVGGKAAPIKCVEPLILVDLKGFEPLTSSMPFKKHQSPTDISTEKKASSGEFVGDGER